MKKSIVLLFVVFSFTVFAQQDNIIKQFYNEHNSALQDFALEKDTSALIQFYGSCIEKYDSRFLNDINFDDDNGFDYAVKLKNYNLANTFFKYEITTGLSKPMIDNYAKKPLFESYFATEGAQNIVNDYEKYTNTYKSGIDLSYLSTINGCFATDQWARGLLGNNYSWTTGNAYKRFQFIEDSTRKKAYKAMIDVTDSLNFAILYDAIKNYGFFTSSKIRGSLGPMLVHLYGPGRDQTHLGISSTQFLDSVMLKAVKEGEFYGREYIFMKDVPEYPYSFDTKSTYGCAVPGKTGYYIPNAIIDIKNLDRRRAELYLPPLWVDALIYDFELPLGYTKP